MTHHGNVPAGWYDDGTGTGAQRWWDGQRWTEHRTSPPYRPAPYPRAPGAQPSTPWSGYTGAPGPARGRSRKILPITLAVVAVLVVAFVTYSFFAPGDGNTEWYNEGYAAGRDGAVSLYNISGNAESACNMALLDKIKIGDSKRTRRAKELKRGCLQAVKDLGEK
ncbi:DUF2510 domain-containing protein [Mycobacterium sp. GA-2829]|uniref:DUF2510 domain-containing protein n=1 Tax=Mycobacterium sp. GA-2829 TaxID=1772283 RepID=UPI00073FEB03|nr:DUF2510 domain-containing protein [Mycobacterium sp. GA-2829]KUI29351.1 hypothetical protein AU194_21020 [Mycobacterium sp. GA-2829]